MFPIHRMIAQIFQKIQIQLTNGRQPVYPGSCSQCHMKYHGSKTFLIDLTPDLQIRICDRCYTKKRDAIQEAIAEAQQQTRFCQYMGVFPTGKEELCIPDGLWYEEGWRLHPHYKVLCPFESDIYVPLIKGDKTRFVKMDDVLFMNA